MKGIINRRLSRKILALFLSVIMVFSTGVLCLEALALTDNTTVVLSTDLQEAERNDVVTVSVALKNIKTPIGGIGLHILYDDKVFEIYEDPIFSSSLASFMFQTFNTDISGKVIINTLGLNNINLADGSFVSFKLKVKDTAAFGNSDITFDTNEVNIGYYDNENQTIPITCDNEPTSVDIINPITSIDISNTTLSLNKGQSSTLSVTVNPTDTTDDKTVAWSSDNDEVATVDNNGKVTAVSAGTANIKATVGGFEKQCTVTVSVPLTGIELNKSTALIHKGNTETLTVSYNPTDTTDDKTVTWTSTNENVATVDNNGKVTALGSGETEIKAQVGSHFDTCVVTVDVPLTGISLNKSATEIHKGSSETLSVIYNPEDTTDNKTVSWSSDNESVATVDNTGKVTAIKAGTANIKASVGGFEKQCAVTVTVPLTGITLNKDATLIHKGDKETLTVTYNPEDTTDNKTITWSSNNTSVATVDNNGKITAVNKGSATIKAQVGSHFDTCEITVDIPLASISLNKTSTEINKGKFETLIVSYNPSDTTDDKTVSWSSNNTSVAKVDNTGKVTAIAVGTATITADVDGKKAYCVVSVKSPLTGIGLNKYSTTILKGNTETLTVIYESEDTTDSKAVTWTSNDNSIATVDSNGKITAVSGGTTTIKAEVGSFSKTCTVFVESPMTGIEINKTATTLNKGANESLSITFTPADTTADRTITWTSSNSAIATVDSNGNVKAIAVGTATIKAEVGSFSKTCTVTVKSPMTGIAINKTTTTINKCKNETLNISFLPADTTDDRTITWTSNNPSVATVDNTGKVTAIAVGTATIKAEVGSFSKTCVVTVDSPMIGIEIDKTTATINKNNSETLSITFLPADTTDDKTITWTSNNPSVATVDNTGKVTAVAVGTATIKAEVGSFSKTCTVTVKSPMTGIAINKTATTINKGKSETLTISFLPADTTDDRTITWTSDNPSVATVDNSGKVTVVAVGTAVIKAEVGGFSKTCTVTVKSPMTGIEINKTSTTLNKGSGETLSITFTPADTTDDKTITWTSNNPSVATVDNNGNVTAIAVGTAVIKAEVGSFSKTCTVTVKSLMTGIDLNKLTLTLNKGKKETLSVIYNPSDTTDDKTVTWTSSDPFVATVDNTGKVTAIAVGTAIIKAEVGSFSKSCTVTVKSPMTGIEINKTSTTLNKGADETLNITFTPADTTDDKTITWTSDNNAVATVDNTGKVTAVAVGTAIIKAEVGGFFKTCTVTVKSPMTGIEISDATKALVKGQTANLTISYLPADTTDDKTVTWSSSDNSVATVDTNGQVKALKAGTATIKAEVGSFSKTCVVTVTEIPLNGIAVNKAAVALKVYDTDILSVIINPENTTDELGTVTWKSDDETVVTVDENGKITAVKAGTAKITATLNEKQAECIVTVADIEISGMIISNGSATIDNSAFKLTVGNATKLNVKFTPNNHTAVAGVVSFSSSDTSVVTVDENGNVKALKTGTAVITVSMNGIEEDITVTVEGTPEKEPDKMPTSPATGDTSNVFLWAVIAMLSAAALVCCTVKGNRTTSKHSR